MTNRPKIIGTKGETAVVNALRRLGFPDAERHVMKGARDVGDVWPMPTARGLSIIEVKAGEMARAASHELVQLWMLEAETEAKNAGAAIGILVVQRRGVGEANAHRWWAYMRLRVLINMFATASIVPPDAVLRMTVEEMAGLLHAGGFGPEELS